MPKEMPVVSRGRLIDPQHAGPSIALDTPAWFAWLTAATTTRFAYALFNPAQGYIDGFMTVRKECRQRGHAYWTAYRRQGLRLRKVYLGSATALTQARLEQIAAQLRARDGPHKNHTFLSSVGGKGSGTIVQGEERLAKADEKKKDCADQRRLVFD